MISISTSTFRKSTFRKSGAKYIGDKPSASGNLPKQSHAIIFHRLFSLLFFYAREKIYTALSLPQKSVRFRGVTHDLYSIVSLYPLLEKVEQNI